jgi:hypothetical protein
MKLTVAILLMPMLAFAQVDVSFSNRQNTERFLTSYLKTEGNAIMPSTSRVTKFIDKLSAHPEQYDKHQQRFLRQIFVKTHSRFLRTFKPYAIFSQLFSNGDYNCLTATALLAVTLKHFDYSFRIFETNHHIFILVETDLGTTLLESTDPIYGFITDTRLIDEKISGYKSAKGADTDSRVIHYKFQSSLYNEVDLENLTGLLHFNLSVNAYNAKNFERTTFHLEQTGQYYQSSRVIEFSEVILLTLKELKVKDAAPLSARLRKVKKASAHVVASTKKF